MHWSVDKGRVRIVHGVGGRASFAPCGELGPAPAQGARKGSAPRVTALVGAGNHIRWLPFREQRPARAPGLLVTSPDGCTRVVVAVEVGLPHYS